MSNLARYITPKLLIPLAVLTAILCFIAYYWHLSRRSPFDWVREQSKRPRLSFPAALHPMERRDVLPVLVITAVYAFTAFFQLGSVRAPQSFVDMKGGKTVEVELSQTVYLSKLRYYPGLGTGDYNVEISSDGEHWSTLWTHKDDEGKVTGYYWANAEDFDPSYALPQHYADLFKWLDIEPENPQNVRYIRITGKADYGQSLLELGELALFTKATQDAPHTLLSVSSDPAAGATVTVTGGETLFNEQDTVPDALSWYNSSYFDEIYHPRTAYEHIRGIYPYEVSHPPLGKIIIGLGIRMFGMTPFGWRFMGVLFGVGMVPLIYLFLKNLFGKTPVAACGTILFAFDFMHLAQTRLATIDTYAVFFILLMYYFLYRYLVLPAGTPFKKCALPLFLSGLFWGIGVACKWTVIYGGIGLAVLYFIGLGFKLRDWPKGDAGDETVPAQKGPWVGAVIAFSVLCFVLIPAVIYTASYIPYAQARGVDLSLGNTLNGIGESIPVLVKNLWGHFTGGEEFQAAAIPQDSLTGIMANNQWSMLTYHQGVSQEHPYSSRWYQWIVDARPILYYMDNAVTGYTTRFAAFNNPVVCWAGLLALISVGVEIFRRRCGKALFILIGYFSQLGPWLLIRRTTFEYHYFPCLIFLVLAIAYLMDGIIERAEDGRWKVPVYALTGGTAAAYALFYPALIGLQVPNWYSNNFLQWLPSWPL